MADSNAFQCDSGAGALSNYAKLPQLGDPFMEYFIFILKIREQEPGGREQSKEKDYWGDWIKRQGKVSEQPGRRIRSTRSKRQWRGKVRRARAARLNGLQVKIVFLRVLWWDNWSHWVSVLPVRKWFPGGKGKTFGNSQLLFLCILYWNQKGLLTDTHDW